MDPTRPQNEINILDSAAAIFFCVDAVTNLRLAATCKVDRTFGETWGKSLSWKKLAVSRKLAIIFLIVISCGIFLLITLVYMLVARQNQKTKLAMLDRAIHSAAVKGEKTGEQDAGQLATSAAASLQLAQSKAFVAPAPEKAGRPLSGYANIFPSGSYIGKILDAYGPRLASDAVEISGQTAENYGSYFLVESCVVTTHGPDGSTLTVTDRTEITPNEAATVAGLKYFLHKYISEGKPAQAERQIAVLCSILECIINCDDISKLNRNPFNDAAARLIQRDPNGKFEAMSKVINSLFFEEIPQSLTGEFAERAEEIAKMRSEDPLRLLQEYGQAHTILEFNIGTDTATAYHQVLAGMDSGDDSPLSVAICTGAYRKMLDKSEVLRALAALATLGGNHFVFPSTLKPDVPCQGLDANGFPLFIATIGESGKKENIWLTADVIVDLLHSEPRVPATFSDQAIATIVSAAKARWPQHSVDQYLDAFDENGYIVKFFKSNPHYGLLPSPVAEGNAKNWHSMIDNVDGANVVSILVAMACFFRQYALSKDETAKLWLTALAYILGKPKNAPVHLLVGADTARKLKTTSCTCKTLRTVFNFEKVPGDEELRKLFAADPQEFVDQFNAELRSMEFPVEFQSFEPYHVTSIAKPAIVKIDSAIRFIIHSRANKKMCEDSEIFRALYLLNDAEIIKFHVGADAIEGQSLDADGFPVCIKLNNDTYGSDMHHEIFKHILDKYVGNPHEKKKQLLESTPILRKAFDVLLSALEKKYGEDDFASCRALIEHFEPIDCD
ncbi:MAG: hypothetical protein LBB38_02790 [Puniceicoccales bacterium]|jgi:hypothetical protein|nr:hypothetical protein [Puniceicoccales bacterium]